VLSALVIGPFFVISFFWPVPLFTILMLWVAAGMLLEWFHITESSSLDLICGLILIPQAIISLIVVSYVDDSRLLLPYYFTIIWSVDTFAMVGGKTIKGPKLVPVLSPNKTWSGLITGVLSAGFMVSILNVIPRLGISNHYKIESIELFLGAVGLAFVAQVSDLLVSHFKRKFHVKDSGNVIPGHGGVLDRFDSIILTAWVVLWIAISLYS